MEQFVTFLYPPVESGGTMILHTNKNKQQLLLVPSTSRREGRGWGRCWPYSSISGSSDEAYLQSECKHDRGDNFFSLESYWVLTTKKPQQTNSLWKNCLLMYYVLVLFWNLSQFFNTQLVSCLYQMKSRARESWETVAIFRVTTMHNVWWCEDEKLHRTKTCFTNYNKEALHKSWFRHWNKTYSVFSLGDCPLPKTTT